MNGRSYGRCGSDTGATVVEAALALPIVLFFVMGMLDLGLGELRNSQVTSAARDGTRTGIIAWVGADAGTYSGGTCPAPSPTPPVVSASFTSICGSVVKRMAGAPISSVSVTCFVGATSTVRPCTKGVIVEGIDMVRVTATAIYTPVTPIGRTFMGSQKTITATARMVIQ